MLRCDLVDSCSLIRVLLTATVVTVEPVGHRGYATCCTNLATILVQCLGDKKMPDCSSYVQIVMQETWPAARASRRLSFIKLHRPESCGNEAVVPHLIRGAAGVLHNIPQLKYVTPCSTRNGQWGKRRQQIADSETRTKITTYPTL